MEKVSSHPKKMNKKSKKYLKSNKKESKVESGNEEERSKDISRRKNKRQLFADILEDNAKPTPEPTLYITEDLTDQDTLLVLTSPVLFSEIEDSPVKVFTGPDIIPEMQKNPKLPEQQLVASTSNNIAAQTNSVSSESQEESEQSSFDGCLRLQLSSDSNFDETKCPLETSGWPSGYEETPKKKRKIIVQEPLSSDETDTDPLNSSSLQEDDSTQQSRSDEAEAAQSLE